MKIRATVPKMTAAALAAAAQSAALPGVAYDGFCSDGTTIVPGACLELDVTMSPEEPKAISLKDALAFLVKQLKAAGAAEGTVYLGDSVNVLNATSGEIVHQ